DDMGDDLLIARDSLKFYRARPGARHRLDGLHGRFQSSTVRTEWQISDDKGVWTCPANSPDMSRDHLNRGVNRALKPVERHCDTVTYKKSIHAGLDGQLCENRVVNAEHRYFPAVQFRFPEIQNPPKRLL